MTTKTHLLIRNLAAGQLGAYNSHVLHGAWSKDALLAFARRRHPAGSEITASTWFRRGEDSREPVITTDLFAWEGI